MPFQNFQNLQEVDVKDNFSVHLNKCHPVLDKILTKNAKSFKIKFFQCALTNFFLIMVVSHNDHLLNNLGKEHHFPRGFPILWDRTSCASELYGFYCKFENDKDNDDEDDDNDAKDFRNCISIRMNYKYSGFLGQVFAFKQNGQYYWSVCAKNTACVRDGEFDFSADAARIIAPKMTLELITFMADNNVFFCGEVMSRGDANHGALVRKETLVVTMVGTSRCAKQTAEEIIFKGSDKPFRSERTQDQVFDFALRFNLDVDNVFTIGKNFENFGQELRRQRSQMNLSRFEDFIVKMTKPCNIVTRLGTIKHGDVLGGRLEGVILKLDMPDGKEPKFIKYKFPFYTIVTMLIRNIIMSNVDSRKPENFEIIKQRLVQWYTPSYYAHLRLWIERWVQVDKDYWFFVGTLIVAKIQELMEQYNPASGVGFQIFVLDSIASLPEFQFNESIDYKSVSNAFRLWNDEESKDLVSLLVHKTIVIATGTPNSAFAKKLDQRFVIVLTKSIKETITAIVSVFENGQIPVILTELSTFVGGKNHMRMLFGQSILETIHDKVINCIVIAPEGNVENKEAFALLQPKGIHQKKFDADISKANQKLELVPVFIENLKQCEMLGNVLTYGDPSLDSLLEKL